MIFIWFAGTKCGLQKTSKDAGSKAPFIIPSKFLVVKLFHTEYESITLEFE